MTLNFLTICYLNGQAQIGFSIVSDSYVKTEYRIDTVIIFDPETQIETVKINKYDAIGLYLNACSKEDRTFKLGTFFVAEDQIRKAGHLFFHCASEPQAWQYEILSYIMRVQKPNGTSYNLVQSGEAFSESVKQIMTELQKGDRIVFENLNVNPKGNPTLEISFTLIVQ